MVAYAENEQGDAYDYHIVLKLLLAVIIIIIISLIWRIIQVLMGLANTIFKFPRPRSGGGGIPFGPRGGGRYLHKIDHEKVYPERRPKLVDFDVIDSFGNRFYRATKSIEQTIFRLYCYRKMEATTPMFHYANATWKWTSSTPFFCKTEDCA